MPGERLAVRGTSEVGRFPGAAPPTRVELTIHKDGEKKLEEGGCRRWFKKMCPCCCKRQSNTHDVTDKVEFVKPPAPTPTPEPAKLTVENGEAKEMEGNNVTNITPTSQITHADTYLHFDPPLSEMKLSVCSVDLLSSKTDQNRKEHHTELFQGDDMIIRRGQTFQIEMELNRPFSTDNDKLHLDLKTGMEQIDSICTHVRIP